MVVPGIVATGCTVLIGALLALSVDDSDTSSLRSLFLCSECSDPVNSRVFVRSRESPVGLGAWSKAELRVTFSPRMKRR